MIEQLKNILPDNKIDEFLEITNKMKVTHGRPIYYGFEYEKVLGIKDLDKPTWGVPIKLEDDEVPIFSACGGTANSIFEECTHIEIACSCEENNLLITDIEVDEIIDLF